MCVRSPFPDPSPTPKPEETGAAIFSPATNQLVFAAGKLTQWNRCTVCKGCNPICNTADTSTLPYPWNRDCNPCI
jgi:hypothetical protein